MNAWSHASEAFTSLPYVTAKEENFTPFDAAAFTSLVPKSLQLLGPSAHLKSERPEDPRVLAVLIGWKLLCVSAWCMSVYVKENVDSSALDWLADPGT